MPDPYKIRIVKMRYSLNVRLSRIQVIEVPGANMLGHLPLGLQAAHLCHDQSPIVCMLVQTDMQDGIAPSCTLQQHLMPQPKLMSQHMYINPSQQLANAGHR